MVSFSSAFSTASVWENSILARELTHALIYLKALVLPHLLCNIFGGLDDTINDLLAVSKIEGTFSNNWGCNKFMHIACVQSCNLNA